MIVGFFAAGSVGAQIDYCFKNEGPKLRETVSFTAIKNNIEGTFLVDNPDQERPARAYQFTGTKRANVLTVKFKDKMPYDLAPDTKVITWTLAGETLKIPMYGKNTVTQKPSPYTARFTRCNEI